MTDVRIKDIRVLPRSLDLKNNAGKSLLEILGQLQSGTIVNGLVVGTTNNDEAIFHSSFGRFAIKNYMNLERGDKIILQLVDGENGSADSVISVNDKKHNSSEILKLGAPLVEDDSIDFQKSNKLSNAVNTDNIRGIPKMIDGSISYLNLSKINKSSPIFHVLSSIVAPDEGIKISLKTISDREISKSPFVFSGEVSRNLKEGDQLITTNFGVILSKGTNMPVGQKLSLEIINLNNQSILNIMNNNVSEFLYTANKNWPLLKNLIQVMQLNSIVVKETKTSPANIVPQTESSSMGQEAIKESIILGAKDLFANAQNFQAMHTKNKRFPQRNTKIERLETSLPNKIGINNINAPKVKDESSVNGVIKNFGNLEEVRKLFSGFLSLKELILPSIREVDDLGKWHNIILPFYNGEKVDNHEIQIHRPSKQFLRFIINIELLDNPMQIDGLIKFINNTKNPENFDLIIRSKNPLDPSIQTSISQIYKLNQSMSGMQGFLSIEHKDF